MNTDDFHYITEALIASKHLIELGMPNTLHTKTVLSRIEDATHLVREIHDARIIERHEEAIASVPENEVDRYFRESHVSVSSDDMTRHTILIGEKHVVQGFMGPTTATCRDAPFHVNGVQYGPGETAQVRNGDKVGLGVLREGPKQDPRFSGDTCVSQPQRDHGDESGLVDAAQHGGLQHGVKEAEAKIPSARDEVLKTVREALQNAGFKDSDVAEIMDRVLPPLDEHEPPQEVKDAFYRVLKGLGLSTDNVRFRRIG